RLQRLATTLRLDSTVTWTGALTRAEVVVPLQRANAFVLPMRTRLRGLYPEGLGLAALEAAACGLPVIVGASGGAPETVRVGESGFVVEPEDPVALADRLAGLLTDPKQARRMGAAGRTHVITRFGAATARVTLRQSLGLDATAGPAGQPASP
ncbi:MAG: glycosyltransferase, partial [Actinomycetes bacterium]